MRLRRRRRGAAVRPVKRYGVPCPPGRADRSGPRRAGEPCWWRAWWRRRHARARRRRPATPPCRRPGPPARRRARLGLRIFVRRTRCPVIRAGGSLIPLTCTSSGGSPTGPMCCPAPRSGCSCRPRRVASGSARSGWAGTAATWPGWCGSRRGCRDASSQGPRSSSRDRWWSRPGGRAWLCRRRAGRPVRICCGWMPPPACRATCRS